MNTFLIFVTQVTLSLLSFGLISAWVIYPRLRDRSLRDALTPLLLFETLRTIGLIVLVQDLVAATLPAGFAVPAALGDMLAVVLAFAALVAVRADWQIAPALVWLFTVVGLVDFINAVAQAVRFDVVEQHQLGLAWLLPTYGVPAFTVAQVMVIALLVTRGRQRAEGDRKQAVDVPGRLTASIS